MRALLLKFNNLLWIHHQSQSLDQYCLWFYSKNWRIFSLFVLVCVCVLVFKCVCVCVCVIISWYYIHYMSKTTESLKWVYVCNFLSLEQCYVNLNVEFIEANKRYDSSSILKTKYFWKQEKIPTYLFSHLSQLSPCLLVYGGKYGVRYCLHTPFKNIFMWVHLV